MAIQPGVHFLATAEPAIRYTGNARSVRALRRMGDMAGAGLPRWCWMGLSWLPLWVGYLLFAGRLSLAEALSGCLAGLAAAGLGQAQAQGGRSLRLSGRSVGDVRHALLGLVPDTLRVGQVLARALWARPGGAAGAERWLAADADALGGDPDGSAAGCRAVATLAWSFAPNGFVLEPPGDGMPPAEAMLLHVLALPVRPGGTPA